jgi:hypothetical protein
VQAVVYSFRSIKVGERGPTLRRVRGSMMLENKLRTMLEMQDRINSRINSRWREMNHAWYRAIWTECAEMMDHVGWKWWRKNETKWDQIHLELVDIWHFGLSDVLQRGEIERSCDELSAIFRIDSGVKGLADLDLVRTTIEEFATAALRDKRFAASLFATLLMSCGLSFTELFRGYAMKNVLNFFRQDYGYNSGTYEKTWSGREDNEHLVELASKMDIEAEDFVEQLYEKLKARYGSVTKK